MTTFLLDQLAVTAAARALYEARCAAPWDEAGMDAEETAAIHANYETDAEAAIQAYLNDVRVIYDAKRFDPAP